MPFSSSPLGPSGPSPLAVLRALDNFMDMPVSEKPTYLEKKRDLLLTDTAEQILTRRITSSDPQEAIILKFYRWFLRSARQKERAIACEELLYLTDLNYRKSFVSLLEYFFRPETLREGRCMLEQHLELLDPALDSALEAIMTLIVQNPDMFDKEHNVMTPAHLEEMEDIWDSLRLLMQVRRDAHRRGSTAASIAEACVNYFGGLSLDAPSWLVEGEEKYFELMEQGPTPQTSEAQEPILSKLIERAQKDAQVAPETLAELLMLQARRILHRNLNKRSQQAYAAYEEVLELLKLVSPIYTFERYPYRFALVQKLAGDACLQLLKGDRRQNLEDAIRSYTEALRILSPDVSPSRWAETQITLSSTYRDRLAGPRDENMEEAIKAAEDALTVLTLQNSPIVWASAQHMLGNAYFFRIKGEKADNVERALMHYHEALGGIKRDPNRHAQAMVYYSLGSCYNERFEGPPEDNIEQAITYYKAAEQDITDDDYPQDWAMIQVGLGQAYFRHPRGSQRDNIEKAIKYFNTALEIFKSHASTKELTGVHQNLGAGYGMRIAGSRSENLENAIFHLEQAEKICSRKDDHYQWALLQFTLGNVYSDRMMGSRWNNLVRAGAYYQAALQEWQRSAFPHEWALARSHLGSIYNLMEDQQQAIPCYEDALQHFTRERYLHDWAGIQHNLGIAYRDLASGNKSENIQQALNHLQAAQEVHNRQDYPTEWAMLQEALGTTYLQRPDKERQDNFQEAIAYYKAALQVYEKNHNLGSQRAVLMRVGNVEAEGGHWEAALKYFRQAAEAENELVQLAAGAMARDLIRGETADASTRVGYALVRLGRYEEAAIALEKGQARDLAEGLSLDTAPDKIKDATRRERFMQVREKHLTAMRAVNMPFSTREAVPGSTGSRKVPDEAELRQREVHATEESHRVKYDYDAVVQEIQATEDPNILKDVVEARTILNAAAHIGPQHALAYLVATSWGGFALMARNASQGAGEEARFFAVDLPQLTMHQIGRLLGTRFHDGTGAFSGGYAYAQRDEGFDLLIPWLRQGKTFHQAATLLHAHCLEHQYDSTLDHAAQEVQAAASLASQIDIPLEVDDILEGKKVPGIDRLRFEFYEVFLRHEIQHSFRILGPIALSPLMAALQRRGISSLTLLPCGLLAAFPLAAVPLQDGRSVGSIMPTSVAPSARSLQPETGGVGTEARDEPQKTSSKQHAGVYALGNPRKDLEWGEAEAQAIWNIAKSLQLEQLKGGKVWVQGDATYTNLSEALEKGLVVDISSHAAFDTADFRKSMLLLAGNLSSEKDHLTLGELLSHSVDLHGMRLLILSACQTAVLDLTGAVNEVRSLASGVLQSGAQAVLASLWSVDEYATYLLIVYFAQRWLPSMEGISPASALAEAQQWLRTVTWGALQQWKATPTMVRGLRYESDHAQELVRWDAQRHAPDECPFASPVYWAGFQLTGW